jgi:hypothetical protein
VRGEKEGYPLGCDLVALRLRERHRKRHGGRGDNDGWTAEGKEGGRKKVRVSHVKDRGDLRIALSHIRGCRSGPDRTEHTALDVGDRGERDHPIIYIYERAIEEKTHTHTLVCKYMHTHTHTHTQHKTDKSNSGFDNFVFYICILFLEFSKKSRSLGLYHTCGSCQIHV